MHEVPTPDWIAKKQLSGPTYLVTHYSPKGALALPGLLFVALGILFLVTGRPDMFFGILVIGAMVTAVVVLCLARFRFLASETWLAAEYILINRLVRLDELVKASVSSGSWTYLTLRDAHGGSIMVQVSTTLPRVRPQVVKWIIHAMERGMKLNDRTLRTLGLKVISSGGPPHGASRGG